MSSNAIDLATLSSETNNDKNINTNTNKDNNNNNDNGSPSNHDKINNRSDIPVATPQNTTSISFSNLGSLSAKKKTSQSPLQPSLLPQLSAFSTGTSQRM